nr:hypothetical protein HAGR004_22600 [Bdellovibrio sp. HAGR004]
MSRFIGFILFFILAVSSWVQAASPEKAGLHLSFEERLVLSYALLSQNETPETKEAILKRAMTYIESTYKLPVKTVEVRNFNEFLSLYKGSWPNTHSLALDVESIETRGPRAVSVFTAKSPRVQQQIDSYLEWKQAELLKMMDGDLKSLTPDQILEQAKGVLSSSSGRLQMARTLLQVSEDMLNTKMAELDHVGEKIAQSNLAAQQDATMKIFLQTMFTEYFARLSPASKKLIVSSYLGGDLHLSEMKKFELMVQNSGPQLQKLLQVVARQADLGPEMLEVFKGLENSVRPVPWEQVESILKRKNNKFAFTYFERKPLGVGTMAQVHRAKLMIDGERHDVVVRFIKPGIEARVEEDKRILQEVAQILDANEEFRKTGAPKLSPVVQDITDTVVAELNQADTVLRQKLAAGRYEKAAFLKSTQYKNELYFHVPKIYDGPKDSDLMVQEMVIGKKLDKEIAPYKEMAPDMKKLIVEEMARIWSKEVMFGGGFYHSDLHQGNFMIQVTEPKIVVNILDYGMGGVISKEMQRQVMLLGAGTELLNEELMARAFWKLSDKSKNTITESYFHQLIAAKMHNIRIGYEEPLSMEKWTAFAMDLGLRLPYEFVSLNRGLVIVNKLLADAGSTLTVSQMMKDLAKQHPVVVYRALVLEEKMSHRDLVKLGWTEVKNTLGFKVPEATVKAGAIRCEMVFN